MVSISKQKILQKVLSQFVKYSRDLVVSWIKSTCNSRRSTTLTWHMSIYIEITVTDTKETTVNITYSIV